MAGRVDAPPPHLPRLLPLGRHGRPGVDLGPQGMGYALRHAIQRRPGLRSGSLSMALDRWLSGTTTDADRVALARELAAL